MKLLTLSLIAVAMFGQTARNPEPSRQAPASAIPDKLALEITRTQRDLLVQDATMRDAVGKFNAAKAQTEKLQKDLGAQIAEASRACGDKQTFDASAVACVPKPEKKASNP